jgi:ribosomal protein S7
MPVKLEFYLFNRILHSLIRKGYKIKALNVFYKVISNMKVNAIDEIKELKKTIVFYKFILNIRPIVYAINQKKKRKTILMPIVIRKKEQLKRSLFWLKESDKARKERKLVERLYNELLEGYDGLGISVNRKFEFYDIALTQRPFLHILGLLK